VDDALARRASPHELYLVVAVAVDHERVAKLAGGRAHVGKVDRVVAKNVRAAGSKPAALSWGVE
jgi:hypothetical protein